MAFMAFKQDFSFWGLLVSFGVVIVGFVMVFTQGESTNRYPDPVLKCRSVVEEQPCNYSEQLTVEGLIERQLSDFESFKDSDPDKAKQFIEYTLQLNVRRGRDMGFHNGGDDYETAEIDLRNDMGRITGQDSIPFLCPTCAEWSVYRAIKCGNPEVECGTIFLRTPFVKRGNYADICPKCKYSANEERVKARKEEKKAEKARKKEKKKKKKK